MMTMDAHHLFLVSQQPINLINAFLTKGQLKMSQEFNLSLRSLDNSKTIHLGSLEVRPNHHIELKTTKLGPSEIKIDFG